MPRKVGMAIDARIRVREAAEPAQSRGKAEDCPRGQQCSRQCLHDGLFGTGSYLPGPVWPRSSHFK
jgi:hypothetical protein